MSEPTTDTLPERVVALPERRAAQDDTLRGVIEVAQWLLDHPEVPIPATLGTSNHTYWISTIDDGQLIDVPATMGELVKRIGSCDKQVSPYAFKLVKEFEHANLVIAADREQVCTPKVVGRKKVRKSVVVRPEETAYVDVEVDDIEWDCPPSLLASAENADA